MRKLIVTCVFMLAFAASSSAQFKFGAGAQLFDGSFGLQGKANNAFTEDFSGQVSFTYYLESGITLWALDADVHYYGFELGDLESFKLAPFAGLNFLNASVGGFSDSNIGLNVGINGSLPLDGGLEIYIEPKLVIAGGSGFAISGGVYF